MNPLRKLLSNFLLSDSQQYSEIVSFVSFPKSGRTWIELMTAFVASSLSNKDIRDFLGKSPITYVDDQTKQVLPFVAFSHGYENFEICRNGTFPTEFYSGKRVVLLVRDPRDTLVSNYYYQKWHHELFDGTLTDFIHYPHEDAEGKATRYGIAPIIQYMNAWIENRKLLKQFHVIRYEAMKSNQRTALTDYFDFLGIPVSEQLLDQTIAYGSFDNMRKLELSNELNWYALGGASSDKGLKTRKGGSGSYREELTPGDLAFVDNYIEAHLSSYFSDYINPSK